MKKHIHKYKAIGITTIDKYPGTSAPQPTTALVQNCECGKIKITVLQI